MRLLSVLFMSLVLGLVVVLPGAVVAQEGGQAATKENLDLPFDAFGQAEEEEEAPEVVFFYGQQFEGDGFHFCLDRSSSTAQGELEKEKREAIQTISQFSSKVQFSVVFYDQQVIKWPGTGRPAEASQGMKSSAIAWLSTIVPGRGTCVREGLLESIRFANRSSTQRNVVIYLGDGGTTCPGHNSAQYGQQTLSQVTGANFKRHRLDAICVGSDSVNVTFCQQISALNGGTMRRVQ